MFYDKLKFKLDRSCGECTKCCEGVFNLYCNNELIQSVGKPCKFVRNGGCSIYDTRPECCKTFMCLYKTDYAVPQWMKPNLSNVLLKIQHIENTKILEVFSCGDNISDEVIDWICDTFKEKKFLYIIFFKNDTSYHLTADTYLFSKIQKTLQNNNNNLKIESAKHCDLFSNRIDNLID